jgi:carbon monoxide dehydrogenase subunit G
MGKKIGLAAGIAVIAAVAVLGVLRSRGTCYPVERSATIAAPPAAVQSRIADLQQWTTWSPWERPDADFDRKFEGPASGAGASYSWVGGEDVGAGSLTVVSAGPEQVHVRSQIERPRRQASNFEFTFVPQEKGTRVTWTATCEKDRSGRLRELLADAWVASAADLELGLARLKSVAEAEAAVERYRVERSTTIEAPAEVVQRHLVDLRNWTDWSAREALDRRMHEQFAGPAMAPGSTYNWSGDDAVGSGRVTLVAAEPGKVDLEVRVDKPTASLSDLEFRLAPDGKGTRLTWTIAGEKDASGEAFGLFAVPLDRFGDDMENCLARLKVLVEADSRVAAR